MANDVWGEWGQSDWELVLLLDGGHTGEVLGVLLLAEEVPMVLALVLPIVQVLVLLAYR